MVVVVNQAKESIVPITAHESSSPDDISATITNLPHPFHPLRVPDIPQLTILGPNIPQLF